jgi:hypothetical protein
MTIQSLINKHNIKFSANWISERPDGLMEGPHNNYKCRITAGRRGFTLYFSQGYGIQGDPTIERVLDSLASDAADYENAQSFEDWASNYGYDTDSRKAEKIYRAVKRQAEQLKRTIGGEAYNDLLWNTERE